MLRTGAILTGLLLLLLAVGCGDKETVSGPEGAPYHTSLEAAVEAVGTSDKPIVIKFYTERCKWCKTLDTVTLVDSAVVEFFTDEMVLVKIDADQDSLLADEYGVRAYPTMVMVHKDGQEIDRAVGYFEPAEFLETLRNYRLGIGTLDDLLSQVEAEPSRQLYFDIAQKYEYRAGDEEATRWYERVVEEDATDSLASISRISLAHLLRRSEDWDGAMQAYASIAEDFEGQVMAEDAEVWMCITHRQKGDTAAAIACFEGFAEKYPESPDAEYCQGQAAKLKGEEEPSSR